MDGHPSACNSSSAAEKILPNPSSVADQEEVVMYLCINTQMYINIYTYIYMYIYISFFLSAGHGGRLARPAGIQPTRPPPCASERTALGCLLTAAQATKWDLCLRVASPTLNTRDPRIPASSPGPYGYQSSTSKSRGLLCENTETVAVPLAVLLPSF